MSDLKFQFGRRSERNLRTCECDTCGSGYRVSYCKKFDEYICHECQEEEESQEDTLKCVREEVEIFVSENSLDPKKSFEDFYADVDVIQAYEFDEWDKEFYEPYYKIVWQDLQQRNENSSQESTNEVSGDAERE